MPIENYTELFWKSAALLCAGLLGGISIGVLMALAMKRKPGRTMALIYGLAAIPLTSLFYLTGLSGIYFSGIILLSSWLGIFLGSRSGMFQDAGKGGFEFILSQKITYRNRRSVTRLVVVLAISSIALGVAVMELSVSIVDAFEREIQNKVVGFGSHIQIGNYLGDMESTLPRLRTDNDYVEKLKNLRYVESVDAVASLPAMLRSEETQEGILMKGVERDFDWSFFTQNLEEGRLPDLSDPEESREILISRKIATLLDIRVGSVATAYFLSEKPRPRLVKITGIYKTGMAEFDATVILCDIRMIRQIAGFADNEVMGYEVKLESLEFMPLVIDSVNNILPINLSGTSITDVYPQIFEWAAIQHQQVWIIIGMMVLIAVINMVSVILILILERTRTIGLLKAIGLPAFRIRKVFLFSALLLILTGVVAGNLIGLGLIWSQDELGWVAMDEQNYFLDTVPVSWVWGRFFVINLMISLITLFFMILPTLLVTKISPVKALRFD